MKFYGIFIIMLTLLASCRSKEQQDIQQMVSTWQNKKIFFPSHIEFTPPEKDSVQYNIPTGGYKVLVYIDSIGCTSCKLHLPVWKRLIHETDSISHKPISFLFFFHSKNFNEVRDIIKRDEFDHPVCFDYQDSLNKLNHFPADMRFQTFLLDSANRVKVIGNPIHNPKIKELYLKVLTGDSTVKTVEPNTTTTTEFSKTDMGKFPIKESRKAVFTLVNTGQQPLIVSGITTSCGCASVDYNKQPVKPGDKLNITVEMKPENTGYFEKTISVYCNSENSPILLNIKGQAE